MGRNLQDLTHIVNDLEACGVKFRSLKESVDAGNPSGKLVFHLFASLAELEHELVRERTLTRAPRPDCEQFHQKGVDFCAGGYGVQPGRGL